MVATTNNSSALSRALKIRHVQLIALGGIIGSGYFLASGEIIHQVGPSVFLTYIFGGIIIYITMLCLGELATAIPISGSFINYTANFISPTLACGVGWSYWISWVTYIPAECLAGGIILEHFTGINSYIWAVAFGLLVTFINIIRVGIFGEIEFWLAIIKIAALFSFVVISLFIFFGFYNGVSKPVFIGTKYLTGQGGLFPNGVLPLLSAMVLMLVNYQGSEIIGLTAGESMEPDKIIPKTIRNVTFRIIFIYIIPIFCLVLIFPWHKANVNNSVFSDALNFYGLKWAGIVTSIVAFTAALSSSNSGVYGIVRALYALAKIKMAPKSFAKLNHSRVPQNAAIVTLFAVWLVLLASYFFGDTKLYISLLLVSGFTGTLSWISICWAQINFRKSLDEKSLQLLKYKTPGSPYTGILGIVLMLLCLIFLFFNSDPNYKLAFYIGLVVLILPMIIFKFHNKGKIKNLVD